GQIDNSNTKAQAYIYSTDADSFLSNEVLTEEVFGPTALIVECANIEEMIAVAHGLKGQLTITFAATQTDMQQHLVIFEIAKEKCGRILCNGLPTGVEVVYGMHHGGPF